jgi:hypothetical protein
VADTAALIERILADDAMPEHMVTMVDDEQMRALLTRHLGGLVWENDRVPDELTGMSAQDRGIWLSVERFYDAALRAEGIERNARSRTAFRDLVPDAQQVVVSTLIPVIQMLHQIALNPEARRG